MNSKNIKNFTLFVILLIGFSSCSSMMKSYLGIKNPKIYVSTKERYDYYKSLIENSSFETSTRVFKDTTKLFSAFKDISNYQLPLILILDKKENKYYSLDCYEDISYQVEMINEDSFDFIKVASPEFISLVERYINDDTVIISNDSKKLEGGKYDIFYVSGIFLGEKLQKKVNVLNKLESLVSINIIDLSLEQL